MSIQHQKMFMRNYKKERENYHSRPEQMLRNAARKRARRQMEKEGKAEKFDGKDVHHKDNNPLNNDKNNLSLVTQHYNRKEPRLREKKLKLRKEDAASRAKEIADLRAKHRDEIAKEREARDKEREAAEKEREAERAAVEEDMGTVTGPHIAGTGDDSSTVIVRKKKNAAVQRRQKQLLKDRIKELARQWKK